MPIVKPKTRQVVSYDESYKLSVAVIDELKLTPDDEEMMQAMAMYKPRTRFAEGDFVMLMRVPDHLRAREVLPRCWKIRFIITYWAWNVLRINKQYGGKISYQQAMMMLEDYRQVNGGQEYRKPMIYCHGYPHGMYPQSAAWIPEDCLRRTMFTEFNQSWEEIVDEAQAPYLGYDVEKLRGSRIEFEVAPRNYRDGRNLKHPFRAEEPLTNQLMGIPHMDEIMETPIINANPHKLVQLDEDHDIYVVDDPQDDD